VQNEAVGSALALQEMLNLPTPDASGAQKTTVILFTWPSDGQALPFVSYKSDRSDARGSGYAIGRGFLKLRDFLVRLKNDEARCDGCLHLLCHSMGNYVLQNALARIIQFTPASSQPRFFEHVFLCSPDVDEDTLEPGEPLGRLHEIPAA
jgi:esterase/lipase superfamily enzyme